MFGSNERAWQEGEKVQWKEAICRAVSVAAMQRVTEISEVDSQLATLILQRQNAGLSDIS
jgi:hypothetical protein